MATARRVGPIPRNPDAPTFVQQVIADMEILMEENRSAPPEVIRLWRSTLRCYNPGIPGHEVMGDWTVTSSREEWERTRTHG